MGAGGSVRSQSSTPAVRVSRRKIIALSLGPVVPAHTVVPVNTKKLKIKGKKLEKKMKKNDCIFGGELAPILEATEDSDSDHEVAKLDLQDEWYHPCYVPPP